MMSHICGMRQYILHMDSWVSTKHQEDGDPGLKSFILLLKQYDQSGLSFVEMPASNYKTKTLAKCAIFYAETLKSIGFPLCRNASFKQQNEDHS